METWVLLLIIIPPTLLICCCWCGAAYYFMEKKKVDKIVQQKAAGGGATSASTYSAAPAPTTNTTSTRDHTVNEPLLINPASMGGGGFGGEADSGETGVNIPMRETAAAAPAVIQSPVYVPIVEEELPDYGSDNEWWQQPASIVDFVKFGGKGYNWQSRTLEESRMSLGLDKPASRRELSNRETWYQGHFWKMHQDDYNVNGQQWKKTSIFDGSPASQNEQRRRSTWFSKHPNETIDDDDDI